MKLDLKKIIRTAVKYGPIVYPIVKKIIDRKSTSKAPSTQKPRRSKP